MPARDPDHLLDLEARRQLFQLIQDYPGLHEREAARQLGTSQALVNFHRTILEQNGLLTVERGDGTARLYARRTRRGPTVEEKRVLGAMRNRHNLQLALVLLNHGGPMKHGQLAEALHAGKSTVSFYLRKLEGAGIVTKTPDGSFALAEPRRVQEVLVRYRPTPDLVQTFSDLWSALYDV